MKKFIHIILILFVIQSKAQIRISGQLFDLKSRKSIELRKSDEMPRIWLQGDSKLIGFFADTAGKFDFSMSEIEKLGDTLTFSISYFNVDNLNNYADFEIRNIPQDKLKEVLSQLYLTKAYWIPSCGKDCFTVNAKRTFRKKLIEVQTSYMTYYMRRYPSKIRKSELCAKYITDLNKDLIK
jgi:hypothetical protein